jgi:hypothetical protein
MPGERISSLALMRDLIPFDANIDYGMVVCHASGSVTINGVSTPTTDRSIVLPNHANARLAGRAFAGICQQQGDQPNVSVPTPLVSCLNYVAQAKHYQNLKVNYFLARALLQKHQGLHLLISFSQVLQ